MKDIMNKWIDFWTDNYDALDTKDIGENIKLLTAYTIGLPIIATAGVILIPVAVCPRIVRNMIRSIKKNKESKLEEEA